MILKLKKVNVLKLAFFFAALYSLISVFALIFVGCTSVVFTQPFVWWMIIVLPIAYGIGGFIAGLITGGLYNLVSRWIGGLEFDFEEIEKFSE